MSRERMAVIICVVCGTTKEVLSRNADRQKYCSLRCAGAAKQRGSVVTCRACGKEIVKAPWQIKQGGNLYCSRACQYKAYKPGAVAAPVSVTCAFCGKGFERARASYRESGNAFCNRQCKAAYMRQMRGPDHPLWEGGEVYYYGPNWPEQRLAARQRDGYCCQGCGLSEKAHRRALDVHHRRPFRTFGYVPEENDLYLIANDLSNLVTLCPTCHIQAECGKLIV